MSVPICAQLDASPPPCKVAGVALYRLPEPGTAAYARKVALAKRIVLSLAAVVGLTLVGALALGLYYHVTERPAKELFGVHD